MRLFKSTTTGGTNAPMSADGETQRGIPTGSPPTILEKNEEAVAEELLYDLSEQFLASLYGTQQSTDFWRRCVSIS